MKISQIPVASHPHRVAAAVPVVEIADHADPPGIGRENGETNAAHTIELKRMRAELIVEAQIRAFAQQIEVEIGQHGRETIRVLELDRCRRHSAREADSAPRRPANFQEKSGLMNTRLESTLAASRRRDHFGRVRKKNPNDRCDRSSDAAEIVKGSDAVLR